MQFRLHYRGKLKANGNPKHKWEIRTHFHYQLKALWAQEPLIGMRNYINPDYKPTDCYLGEERLGRNFYPIASEKIWTAAELDVLMLCHGEPGVIRGGGGDIDNRLKTLFDALQVPNANSNKETQYLPKAEKSIYCLLQDDKLITRITVETDRLLEPGDGNIVLSEVILIVKVRIRATSGRNCNVSISL